MTAGVTRALVTGGAGFIGSALVQQLQAAGVDTLAVDKLTYAACPNTLDALNIREGDGLEIADICDADAMRAILTGFKPSHVFHLAAESHVDRSIHGSRPFLETNVMGTHALLEAARDYQQASRPDAFRFLHCSTDEVFGSLGETGHFTEDSPYDPSSPYSASKAASDHLVRAWHRTFGLPVMISNCTNNYGPRQFPEKLIPRMIQNALAGRPLPVYGDGRNVRDWLHVDDHARALIAIASRGAPGQTYAVGARCEIANIDLVRKLCALLDARRPDTAPHARLITFVTDRPGHDRRYAIDPTHIETELGWSPVHDFETGLADTLDWYINNADWCAAARARSEEAYL